MEFNLLIGAEAGQGLSSIENGLTDLLSSLHYYFFTTRNYMSRIRGGHNFHMFRIADSPVHALSGREWDMIIALDHETERRHLNGLRADGIHVSFDRAREIERIAKEHYSTALAANPILIGVILSVIGCGPARIPGGAGKLVDPDQVKTGISLAEKWGLANRFFIEPKAGPYFKFDGNQGLALGALMGGCQFMAGYPMTPSTSIMMYISAAALDMPVHFEQAEDEIAAINMALGASYAGLRSMVATSGGGFALMQESVSLAGMTETPIVIIIGQRPGPSTGLPTRTEQGDLNFILHSGHGEFPRILFAPGSIGEAIELAGKSFDLADRYQIPVFILTDQYLADSLQAVEEPVPQYTSRREYRVYGPDYRRYLLTPDGVSPLTFPGLSEAFVKVDSDEHDEEGKITEDHDLRKRMVRKRLTKLKLIRKDSVAPDFFGDKDSDIILICWGSNKLIVKETSERLRSEGLKTGVLHFRQVYPLTREMVLQHYLEKKRTICIENNATGQFANLLRRELDVRVSDRILKYDGTCFTVDELCKEIKGKLGTKSKESDSWLW